MPCLFGPRRALRRSTSGVEERRTGPLEGRNMYEDGEGGGHTSTIGFIGPINSQIPAGAKHSTRCDPCFWFREEKGEEGDGIV